MKYVQVVTIKVDSDQELDNPIDFLKLTSCNQLITIISVSIWIRFNYNCNQVSSLIGTYMIVERKFSQDWLQL